MFERIILITWQKEISIDDISRFKSEWIKLKPQFCMSKLSFLKPADLKSAQSWDLGLVIAFTTMEELKDFFQSFEYQRLYSLFEQKIDCIKGWNFENTQE